MHFYSHEEVGEMNGALADAVATLKRILEYHESIGAGPSLPSDDKT